MHVKDGINFVFDLSDMVGTWGIEVFLSFNHGVDVIWYIMTFVSSFALYSYKKNMVLLMIFEEILINYDNESLIKFSRLYKKHIYNMFILLCNTKPNTSMICHNSYFSSLAT